MNQAPERAARSGRVVLIVLLSAILVAVLALVVTSRAGKDSSSASPYLRGINTAGGNFGPGSQNS